RVVLDMGRRDPGGAPHPAHGGPCLLGARPGGDRHGRRGPDTPPVARAGRDDPVRPARRAAPMGGRRRPRRRPRHLAHRASEPRPTHRTEGPAFWAPAPGEIATDAGARTHRLWLGPGETTLSVPLDAPPRWVAVDAPGGVLATWRHEQPVDAWAAQALGSPTP